MQGRQRPGGIGNLVEPLEQDGCLLEAALPNSQIGEPDEPYHPRPRITAFEHERSRHRDLLAGARAARHGPPQGAARTWRSSPGALQRRASGAWATPTLAIVDELHAHRDAELYVALRTALGKMPGARLLTISTAGHDVDSVLGRLRARALALESKRTEGTLTTAVDARGSFAMLEWATAEDADLEDPDVLKTANPASWVTREWLEEQIHAPGVHPLELSHAGEGRRCGTCRWMKVGPDNSVGANQRVTPAYSPPPPARKPVWPLHASPGWDPSVARTSRTSLGICPQFCTCSAVRPGGGSPSFCPEKTQIEFACAGPAVGFPLPVTSPANAEPAPTAATATAQSAAASNDLKRIAYLHI